MRKEEGITASNNSIIEVEVTVVVVGGVRDSEREKKR